MAALRPAIERVLETDPPVSHNRLHNRHLDSRAGVRPGPLTRRSSGAWLPCTGPICCLAHQLLRQDRGSKAIPWHQDFHYWPLEPPVIISAWIAVDPSTRQNGNLQVIPGSHRTIVPHVEATPDMHFKVMADAGYYDPGDLTDLEMQPGEFILFNERTLHHSEANHSDLRRIGLPVRAIIPIVEVLEYDSPDHTLQIIHGTDTMGPQSRRAAAVLMTVYPSPSAVLGCSSAQTTATTWRAISTASVAWVPVYTSEGMPPGSPFGYRVGT